MPLFQLLWPGMPDFTGRYSSLCVNQSFARDPLGPAPHHSALAHQPLAIPPGAAIPLKPDPTSSFRDGTPHFSPTLPSTPGVSRKRRSQNWRRADHHLPPEDPVGTKTNKHTEDHEGSICPSLPVIKKHIGGAAVRQTWNYTTTTTPSFIAPEFDSSLWCRYKGNFGTTTQIKQLVIEDPDTAGEEVVGGEGEGAGPRREICEWDTFHRAFVVRRDASPRTANRPAALPVDHRRGRANGAAGSKD